MTIIIRDGKGKGNYASVDKSNRLTTHAVTENQNIHAVELGDAFNINTGLITVSGDATLLYFKNNEERDYVIDAIALGSFEGITHSDDPYITLVRNPTGGNLISDETAVSINQNRNFGSNKTLTVDAYKGKTGGTLTGGNDAAILQATPGGRSFYTIDFLLPRGTSVGIKLTANVSSGSASWYAALIGYIKEEQF